MRERRALSVAEDQPAHGGVHVQGLAGASDNPGQPVIEAEGGQAVADTEDPGHPVQQRVPHNVAAFLDMIEANRGVWLAAVAAGTGTNGARPGPDLLREAFLERILANNTDLITDTPWARLCLAREVAFSEAIARRWLLGEAGC